MSLYGDYKEVKSLSVDQACLNLDKTAKELKEIKDKAKNVLSKITGIEGYQKGIRGFLLKNLKKINKAKWEVIVDHRKVPSYSYDILKLLKTKKT